MSNYLFRISIEFDQIDFTQAIEDSRFLYVTSDLAKEGLVKFLIEECGDDFIEIEAPTPTIDSIDWIVDDLDHIRGSMLGWTWDLHIHRMEIKTEDSVNTEALEEARQPGGIDAATYGR